MTLSTKHRWILVARVVLRNEHNAPGHASPLTFREFVEQLSEVRASPKLNYLFNHESKKMALTQIGSFEQDWTSFLITLGDKDVPDVSLTCFDTDKRRDIQKNESEGHLVASHILVCSNTLDDNSYLMLVESVPGINISSIKSYFNYLLREVIKKKEIVTNNECKSYRAVCEVDGFQSSTLREALETGTLQDIRFVSPQIVDDGIDEEKYINEIENEIKIRVGAKIQSSKIGKFMEGVMTRFKKDNNQRMYIRIKTNQSQIKDTEVDLSKSDVLSEAFIQSEKIKDFSDPLVLTYQELSNEIVVKMIEIGKKKLG